MAFLTKKAADSASYLTKELVENCMQKHFNYTALDRSHQDGNPTGRFYIQIHAKDASCHITCMTHF